MVTFIGCTFLLASATLNRNGSSARVGPGGGTCSTCSGAAAAVSWCPPASLTPPNAAPAAKIAGSTIASKLGPPPRGGGGEACFSLLSLMGLGRSGSLLEVHQFLQHLVGGRDRLRVRLEGALMSDEVHELRRDVDVGLLERAGDDRPAPARSGRGCNRLQGAVRIERQRTGGKLRVLARGTALHLAAVGDDVIGPVAGTGAHEINAELMRVAERIVDVERRPVVARRGRVLRI